jgi:hypothetical protein
MAGLLAQKEAIAAGYDALAAKWGKLVLVEGQPADEIDFRTINDPADRDSFYNDLVKKNNVFDEQVNEMVNAIGPPRGCTFSGPQEVSTDSLNTCATDQPSLKAAQQGSPCRQVAALLDKHEAQHRQACTKRVQGGGLWTHSVSGNGVTLQSVAPNRMFTPAGKAREEAAAYRMEAAAYRDLYRQAKAKCRRAEIEVSGDGGSDGRLAQRERLQRAAERVAAYAASI